MKIDADAIERLAQRSRFRPQTLEIARRLLVEGESTAELAAAYGISVPRIKLIKRQVLQALKESKLPPGWGEATIIAPKKMLEEFKKKVKEARRTLSSR